MDVWVHGSVGYVPIAKNASTTYTQLFAGIGWTRTQLDLLDAGIEIFGHFRDPIERHFAGTAEFLCQNHITHLVEDPVWQQMWVRAVMDMHSYPVTWSMGSHAQRCHWIPMHKQLDVDLLTRKYLAQHGITLGEIPHLNTSEPFKQQLHRRLQELHPQIDAHNHLSWFYDSDIVLWNSLFPYVDADNQWHTVY
jgi:hypothetical protein